MKCISLWQPWASLIAVGAKRIETRSWMTSYRGPLAIHAAKRRVSGEEVKMLLSSGASPLASILTSAPGVLPLGAVVATCELVGYVQFLDSLLPGSLFLEGHTWNLTAQERACGDFRPGRFGWLLAGIKPLARPLPWRGRQGLFDVPDAEIKRHEADDGKKGGW